MSFMKQTKTKYTVKSSLLFTAPVGDDFVTLGNIIAPQKPEDLGCPKLEVKSEGKTVYKPRFTITEDKPHYSKPLELVIQFGHYWGGGSYYVSTLEKTGGGLDLYGPDERPDSKISAEEMHKLLGYLKKNKEKLAEAIKQKASK